MPGAAAGVRNRCVVPRPVLTATQEVSGAKAMPRMAAGVTPRYKRYSHTAWPGAAPAPAAKQLPGSAAPGSGSGGGTMAKMLMLCPATEAVASRVPPGLNCSAARGEVCALKWATTRRVTASRTTTVPTTAASACKARGWGGMVVGLYKSPRLLVVAQAQIATSGTMPEARWHWGTLARCCRPHQVNLLSPVRLPPPVCPRPPAAPGPGP